jgi:hypothetical protein
MQPSSALVAYAYAIAAINFGDSTLAIFLAILVPAAYGKNDPAADYGRAPADGIRRN